MVKRKITIFNCANIWNSLRVNSFRTNLWSISLEQFISSCEKSLLIKAGKNLKYQSLISCIQKRLQWISLRSKWTNPTGRHWLTKTPWLNVVKLPHHSQFDCKHDRNFSQLSIRDKQAEAIYSITAVDVMMDVFPLSSNLLIECIKVFLRGEGKCPSTKSTKYMNSYNRYCHPSRTFNKTYFSSITLSRDTLERYWQLLQKAIILCLMLQ